MKSRILSKLDLAVVLVAGTLFFSIPFLASLEFSFREPGKHTYGFDNYIWFLSDPDFSHYILLSFSLAVASALILMVLLVPVVVWLNISGSSLKNVLTFLSLLPLVIPVVALAIGAQDSMPTWTQENQMILAFFYAVLALPYVYRTLDNGLSSVALRSLTEASRSLGANWFTTIWRVIAPAIRGAVIGSLFMTLALSMGEYTLTSLLHWDTFTTWVTYMSQSNLLGSVALSVFSLLVVLAVLLIIGSFVRPAKNSIVSEEN